jgi:hypothetical protein
MDAKPIASASVATAATAATPTPPQPPEAETSLVPEIPSSPPPEVDPLVKAVQADIQEEKAAKERR